MFYTYLLGILYTFPNQNLWLTEKINYIYTQTLSDVVIIFEYTGCFKGKMADTIWSQPDYVTINICFIHIY